MSRMKYVFVLVLVACGSGQREEVAGGNTGFVSGPPKGFPSFQDIGGNFPPFKPDSRGYAEESRPSHPHHPHVEHRPRPQRHEEEEYPRQQRPVRPPHPPHSHGVIRQESSHQHPHRPLVLKVSSKRAHPITHLPPGPPVFFAPSPDSAKKNQGSETRPNRVENQRRKRGTKDEPTASASEYFDLSPYLLFGSLRNLQNTAAALNASYDIEGGEQRFFPSFPASGPYIGPFGPSRPPVFPGPAANRSPARYHAYPKFPAPAANRGPSSAYSAEAPDRYQDNNLLGSGNFEVVRGGTFYEEDDAFHGHGYHHDHDHDGGGGGTGDYYHHNGHSAPAGYRVGGGDFFSNFRDFADINPPSRSFSHLHETRAIRRPKNILDKLESSSDAVAVTADDPMLATY